MDIDDPAKPEFASWDSYAKFAVRVQRGSRYVWQKEVQAFLDTVLATLKERDVTIPSGSLLYRARMGIDYHIQKDEDGNEMGEEPMDYSSEEMKPLREKASEGRANPAGIPVLYLGTSEQTAISEVRPWIGSEVSVAQFKTNRTLRAVDLSRGHGQRSLFHLTFGELFGEKTVEAAKKEKLVWTHLQGALMSAQADSSACCFARPAGDLWDFVLLRCAQS